MVSATCNRQERTSSTLARCGATRTVIAYVCITPEFHRVFPSVYRITDRGRLVSSAKQPPIDEFCCSNGTIFFRDSLPERHEPLTSDNCGTAFAQAALYPRDSARRIESASPLG
jgi:hypothetical protein